MTQEDYIAGLELLMAKRPNHPLLRTLKEGFSKLNSVYMKHALKSIPNATSNEPKHMDPDNDIVRKLMMEKRSLFGRRAKLSNNFHRCQTDADRANVSDDIQKVQRDIEVVMHNIDHYQKNGHLPKRNDKTEINLSGVELQKKLNSIRSNISIKKSTIKKYFRLPDDHPNKKKIPDLEQKLKELEKEKQHVQILIDKEIV